MLPHSGNEYQETGFCSRCTDEFRAYEGKIMLKKGKKVEIDRVAQAVFDAGFSVRYLYADLLIDNSVTATGSCINYKGDQYVITNASNASSRRNRETDIHRKEIHVEK